MKLTGGSEVTETVRFVTMFGKFFDCLNVNNFVTGYHKRKVFKQPYKSTNDFRLKVSNSKSLALKLKSLSLLIIMISVAEGDLSWLSE